MSPRPWVDDGARRALVTAVALLGTLGLVSCGPHRAGDARLVAIGAGINEPPGLSANVYARG